MRVSIALCTFNGERYLSPQLDSLLAQTRLPDQIVICDDLSTDRSWAMLEEFATRASSRGIGVELVCNRSNLGYIKNFESALGIADGEVIFLCDQDDIWAPGKIERIAAEFEARPSLRLVHTDAELVDDSGMAIGCGLFDALELTASEISAVHENRAFNVLVRRSIATGATMAIHRDLLKIALPIPNHWIHDEWLAIVASLNQGMDCLESRLISYRQHASNQIGVRRRGFIEKIRGGGVSKRGYMKQVALRLRCLAEYVDAGRIPMADPDRIQLQQRIEHALVRANMPMRFSDRLVPVMAETRAGRYSRYSSGWRSAISDLLDLRQANTANA